VEVRIGVRDVVREVSFESNQSPEEVQQAVAEAMGSGEGLLTLRDDRGGTVVVPLNALGYVEIGTADKPRVGFGRA
jgi:hypothetical protein